MRALPRMFLLAWAGSLLPPAAAAADCTIRALPFSTVGEPAEFTLQCPDSIGARVSWDFGDGDLLPFARSATVIHVYPAPGSYVVFARLEGEDIPATLLHTVLHPVTPVAPTHSATLLLDRKRGRLWNVNADNHSVTVISAQSLERLKEIPVGRNPRTLARDAQGRIWVANQDDATLSVLDGDRLEPLLTLSLPRASRPFGICFDPQGTTAYVTLEAAGALLAVDGVTGKVRGSLALFPSPRGIAVAADGRRLWVTRFLSPRDSGEVAEVAASPFSLARVIGLAHDDHPDTESNGRGVPNALASITLSPDGKRAWVPSKKDNTRKGLFVDPAGSRTPVFESTVRTIVSQIDLAGGREIRAARLDLDNRSMACAVVFTGNGAFAFAATETSHEIAVINAVDGTLATAIEPRTAGHELGPDGLAVSENDSLLFIHDFLSREVAVYGIGEVGGSNYMPRLALIPTVEREKLAPEVLRGKQIFYNAADTRMSRDKYLSCAVCHLDGGGDGRVWDFTDRGEGLRRTTSLLGKAGLGHGPLHWSANFDEMQDFEHDIRGAFQGTGFLDENLFNQGTRNRPLGDAKAGLSPALDDLAAYVASLARARPSPYRQPDGSFSDEAKAGERLFHREDVGCARCHIPPSYTDSRIPGRPATLPGDFPTAEGFLLHDVGTLRAGSGKRLNDTLRGLDTPTLLGIWESGPYLHDGSAATLEDVITTANAGDRHGRTSQLDVRERAQLAAFLRQIGDGDPSAAVDPRVAGQGRHAPRWSLSARRSRDGWRILLAGGNPQDRPWLEIRNAAGRLQRRFAPRDWLPVPEGREARWDGLDHAAAPAAPGWYLLRARQGAGTASAALAVIP